MGSALSYFSSPSPLLLPSTSPSPSSPPEIKYDVFLSFRGEDTRSNFTSHLNQAFRGKGIDTFIDEDRLNRGDEISPSLLQAIEESQISVVIFSANYANSRWCLEELVKILECKKNHGPIVIPVFYEIDPSHVRHQTGSYGVAFTRHQRRCKADLDKVQKWRCALTEAANLSGFDSLAIKPESVLVEKIVEDVLKRLNNMSSSDKTQPVGIESKITKIEEMLRMGDQTNNDVRRVGICGIGGIGKTTLAKAVFDKIYYQFQGFSFIHSIREASEKNLLNCLRDELYSKILGDKNAYTYIYSKKRLHSKKLLIIFDDVTCFTQVKDLIGDLDWLGLGSRIIITSRDRQVLRNCDVKEEDIYMVEELRSNEALKLFCQHAFKQNSLEVEYKELSKAVVQKVGGVPLALEVLGCFLLGKKEEVWESSMKRITKILDERVHEVLKISYDGLNYDQQRIFLDIACFYKGWDVDIVIAIMNACDFFSVHELSELMDKSLIIILDKKIMMHDLLQTMGKVIVQRESINPGERTRLCDHKDVNDVLTNATGTKTLEGISLDMSKSKDIHLHSHAFANMPNLRLLNFYGYNRMCVAQGLEPIFPNLRYLNWYGCPLKSLQSNVFSKNLVVLEMINSEVKELWSGSQHLDNLKTIVLKGSKHLTRLPDVSKATNLELLDLSGCRSLTEITSSIQHLPKLQCIYLHSSNVVDFVRFERPYYCMESMPDCDGLKSLKEIILGGWDKLKVAPKLPNNVEDLGFYELRSLCEIPSSYKYLTNLKSLCFRGCESLTSVPDWGGFKSLKSLEITRCSKLKMLPEFPNNIKMLEVKDIQIEELPQLPNNVEVLRLKDIPIEELPSSLENLCRIDHLSLEDCSRLKSLPSSVCKLKTLGVLKLVNCPKIDKLPDSLGCLTSLEALFLHNINLESIPESIINLSNLRSLIICYCQRLKVLPKLPCAKITAVNCTSLEQISCPSFHNDMFAYHWNNYLEIMIADFTNCFKLDQNSLDNFAEDSLLEIQGQAASIKKITYQQVDNPLFTIRYPGSEIPVWFEYQNRGSVIDVNLPLNWINYKSLCFALCIVVAIPDGQLIHHGRNLSSPFYVRCECSAKSKDGDRLAVINYASRWPYDSYLWRFDSDCYPRSNHVEIRFGFCFLPEHYGSQLSFQVNLEHDSDDDELVEGLNIDGWKVEKCGVHLMYAQHLELLDEKEEDEPHLEDSDEDDEPHPKRFKYIG